MHDPMVQIESLSESTGAYGWDGEYGAPILPSQWETARNLVFLATQLGMSAPFVSACGDGAVRLQWAGAGVIEICEAQCFWSSGNIIVQVSPLDALTLAREAVLSEAPTHRT